MAENKRTPPCQSRLIPYQDEILRAWFKERADVKDDPAAACGKRY